MKIIGAGRIGTSLARRAHEHGLQAEVIGRDGGGFSDHGPILVATRNDDLPEVVARVPKARHRDLVFLQNGWLRGWLTSQGLEDGTRGLLYFAATARNGPIDAGSTSFFTGPHAPAVASWLQRMELAAEAVDDARFSEVEIEKLAWLCVFGPLCAHYEATVGDICDHHREPLARLTAELADFARIVGVVVPTHQLLEGLVAYSRTIPGYRAGVKEWRWRNGAVLQVMERAGVPSPLQRELTAPFNPAG